MPAKLAFNPRCVKCTRLVQYLKQTRQNHPDYYCQPVAPFGDSQAHVLIVGLAPGLHGANKTGRPFTGDYSGRLLYQTLYKYGLASASDSIDAGDGLQLLNCRITNAVKCVPPQNKPTAAEVSACNTYLAAELSALPDHAVVITLGSIAHNAVLKALGLKQKDYRFGHLQQYQLPTTKKLTLLSSYHCSRYNTQTRRLTEEMFHAVFERTCQLMTND